MFDDKDLEHLEDLVDQARSKLAKTVGYLPDDISESLQDLLNRIRSVSPVADGVVGLV